jgi:predicted nucleotidyltransferase
MNRRNIAINFAKKINNELTKKIILFGSVARGEDKEDFDIDILIVTSNKKELRNYIIDKSFDTNLETGEYISPTIVSIEDYEKYKNFSFFTTVNKEGVVLG